MASLEFRVAGRRAGRAFDAVSSVVMACMAVTGCATLPDRHEFAHTSASYPGGEVPAAEDGRARFREIFCALASARVEHVSDATEGTPAGCDRLLWKLADERAPLRPGPPPAMTRRLRVFVVSGAFGDCRELDTIPYADEIERLSAAGTRAQAVMVSGRSGTEHNARQIAAAVEAAGIAEDEPIVLVGYSKGAVDILQFLVDYPDLAQRVAAVVSVAGPIYGSPLASDADWWYRTFLTKAFSGMCDPGDGGVISSLRPDVRQRWLGEHPLPSHIAFYSMVAFTTGRHLARGLQPSWRLLAGDDRRNDGQVLIEDAVIPHSTLLGYANADHWDVALSLERQMPYLSQRESPRIFPRGLLFDAILLYVGEALERHELLPDLPNQGVHP